MYNKNKIKNHKEIIEKKVNRKKNESLSIVFVCKRRCDEVRREPSSEGAMWCVPGARFFMLGGYAICLGVTRDSNLSISSGTVDGFCGRLARVRRSRSRSWSRGSGNSSSRSRSRRSCGPFAYVSWLQLPPGHGNRAKGQSPTLLPLPQLQLMASSRLQAGQLNQLST